MGRFRWLALLLVAVLASDGLGGGGGSTTVMAQTPMPTISLSFTDTQTPATAITGVSEGGGAQMVRVMATASAPTSALVNVTVTVGDTGGTADKGAANDYQTSRNSVTLAIASGDTAASTDVTITPVSDTRVEGDETIRFTAAAVSGYQPIAAADLMLTDDDDAVTLSLSPEGVLEYGASQSVEVTATFAGDASDLSAATEVTVTVAGGSGGDGAALAADPSSPASGDDFWTDLTSPANQLTVSIPAGSTSGSQSFGLTARADSVDEAAAAEKVALSGSATVSGKSVTVTGAELSIYDRVITLGLADSDGDELTAVGEDDGEQTMRVTASLPAPAPVAIPVSVVVGGSDSTADKGADDDYTTSAASTVDFTIAASSTSGESPLSLSPQPDFVTEDHETIQFTGSSTVSGYAVEATELEITDADRTIAVVLDNDVMNEKFDGTAGTCQDSCQAGGDAAFITRLTAVLQGVESYTYSGTALSNIRLSTTDGTASSGTPNDFLHYFAGSDGPLVTFPQGAAVANADRRVEVFSIVNDDAEPDKDFTLGLAAVEGFTVIPVTVNLADDDVQVALVKAGGGLDDAVPSVDEDATGSQDIVFDAHMRAASSSVGSATTVGGLSVSEPADPPAGRLSAAEFSYTSFAPTSLTIGANAIVSCPDPSDAGSCNRATLAGLRIVDDTVVEGPELIQVSGRPSATGVTFDEELGFDEAVGSVKIVDDDTDITLTVAPDTVAESSSAHKIVVTAAFAGDSSVLTVDTPVTVTVAGGTATIGATNDFTTDLTGNQMTVVIPAGEVSGDKFFNLTARVDTETEGTPETVMFTGTASVGGDAVTVTGDTLTIQDAGGSSITLSLTNTEATPTALTAVDEDGGEQTVRIVATVGTAPTSDLDVAVSISGGTATTWDDYTVSPSSVTVTIPATMTSGHADVTVTPVSDTVTEEHEEIFINGSAAGYLIDTISLTITDADRDITVVVENPRVDEGGDGTGLCYQFGTVSNPYGRNVKAELEGETSTYPRRIGTYDHGSASHLQDMLRLIVHGGPSPNGATRTPGATGTAGTHDFYDFLRQPPGNNSFWAYTPLGPGNVVANFGTVGGGSGFSGNAQTWTCKDDVAEGDETMIYTLWNVPSGFTVVPATVILVDDDSQVRLSGTAVAEGYSGAASITAALPAATSVISTDTTVTVSGFTAGEAAGVADEDDFAFTAPGTAPTITIATTAVSGSAAASLTGLTVADDTVVEGPERLLLEGSSELGDATGSLTINDNDDDIDLSVSPAVVAEGTSETVTVTARFKGTSSALTAATNVTVTVASGDGTGAATLGAVGSGDFTTDATGNEVTVTIPAGEISGSATLAVTAHSDSDNDENVEMGKLTGSASVGGSSVTVTGTGIGIVDADLAVGLTIDADTETSGDQTSLGEDAGTKTVRITAALASGNAPAGGLTLGVNAVGASAVVDDDASFETGEDVRVVYPSGQNLAIQIPAGMNSASGTLTVVLNDDGEAESGEVLRFQGGDVTVGSDTYKIVAADLSITDNDTAPTGVDLTWRTVDGEELETVGEGAGTARVRVRAAFTTEEVLSRNITIPLTVGGSEDTATAGTDYEMVSDLAVTIPARSGSGTVDFDLEVTEDTALEGGETVTVHAGTLSAFLTGLGLTTVNSDSLTVADNDITVTLLDSEGQPLTSLREGASAEATVRAAYPEDVTGSVPRLVRIRTQGSANRGTDYVVRDSEDLLIRYGQNSATDQFTLDATGTYDDNLAEGPETLQVTYSATGFSIPPTVLTLTDDEAAPSRINLSVSPASVREDVGDQMFTVTATLTGSAVLPAPLTVTATIAEGRASGAGYQNLSPARLPVIIPAATAQGQATFSAQILNDSIPGNSKTLRITGTAAGYTVNPATITITDDGDRTAPPPTPPPTGGGGGGGGGGTPPPAGGGGGGGGGGAAPPPAAPTPPAEPACQGRFCDEDGSVHQANIERIAQWRITLGCDANDPTLFCPKANITRSQMAAFLYRAVSQRWTIEEPPTAELSDVAADAWYRTYADWVISINAFAAPNGVFNPRGVVTRADMAIMLIAAFPHLEEVAEPEGLFQDAQNADPAVIRAIEGMYQTGVTRGCSTDPLNYCPNQPVTRAQMASFFVRAIDQAPTQ